MDLTIPRKMKAVVLDHFGGPEVLHPQILPVPEPASDEVLIRLQSAGVGVWDPAVREGELGEGEGFPMVIGNDGAGVVVAAGRKVKRLHVGDLVYAYTMKGGFYAEYVAVSQDDVAPIPSGMTLDEAGALGADGITALRGLDDELRIEPGQTLMIFGASGGIGHIAVQLAKRMGATVLAVASGEDGVSLVRRLGADVAIDGHAEDVAAAARELAPGGVDAALLLAGAREMSAVLTAVRRGGRIAYPRGIEPEPIGPEATAILPYDGVPSPEAFQRLNRLIGDVPLHVELGRVYPLEDAVAAHRAVERHHLGKLALDIHA